MKRIALVFLCFTCLCCNAQKHNEYDTILTQAFASQLMGYYQDAIDKYNIYLEAKYYVKDNMTYDVYGSIGYCQSKLGLYKEAIPNLTKYIKYFGGDNINLITSNKINENNMYLGAYLIARGFCRAKLDDHTGAIADLTKGISFQEMILKFPKYDFDEFNKILGLGYSVRGIQKCIITNSNSGCDDIRKAIELGEESAYKAIEMCP